MRQMHWSPPPPPPPPTPPPPPPRRPQPLPPPQRPRPRRPAAVWMRCQHHTHLLRVVGPMSSPPLRPKCPPQASSSRPRADRASRRCIASTRRTGPRGPPRTPRRASGVTSKPPSQPTATLIVPFHHLEHRMEHRPPIRRRRSGPPGLLLPPRPRLTTLPPFPLPTRGLRIRRLRPQRARWRPLSRLTPPLQILSRRPSTLWRADLLPASLGQGPQPAVRWSMPSGRRLPSRPPLVRRLP